VAGVVLGLRVRGWLTAAGIRDPPTPRPAYQRQWRWPILAAARAGHQAVTARIAEMAAFLAGQAS
jgi:hypothetical protein